MREMLEVLDMWANDTLMNKPKKKGKGKKGKGKEKVVVPPKAKVQLALSPHLLYLIM